MDHDFEKFILNANGNMGDSLEEYASTKVPHTLPFMITIGEKPIEEDPHADKKEQWKKFVHAYKDDYLHHLRNGFQLMVSMLNEITDGLDNDPNTKV